MCITYPGKVIEVKKDYAIVNYGSQKSKAKISFVKPIVGDYVLVFKKYVMEVVNEKDAKKIISTWREMNENKR